MFRRLSVFTGGSTIESATAVCDLEPDVGLDVVEGLGSLIDKSLLRQEEGADGEPRFRMLETIREYGRDRLAESPDAVVTPRRHATWFADLAERAEPKLLGAGQAAWLDILDTEQDNLRAAVRWLADTGDSERALAMAGALWRFWHMRAHLQEGREELEMLLARDDAQSPSRGRARALSGLGGVAYWQGDFARAAAAYAEGLDIDRRLDDPAALADALYNLGFVDMIEDRRDSARALYEESIALYERLADRTGLTKLREALAFLLYLEGDYAAALRLQRENLATFRGLHEPFRIGNALSLVALFSVLVEEWAEARAAVGEAAHIFEAAGDLPSLVNALLVGAFAALQAGDPERAARLSGALAGLREPLGDVASALDILHIADPSAGARSALGDVAYERLAGQGRGLDIAATIRLAEGADEPDPVRELGASAS